MRMLRSLSKLLILITLSLEVYTRNETGMEFISVTSNLTVNRGEDVMFNCNVRNLDGLQILWRKGYGVISAGESMISMDNRFSLTVGNNRHSLHIKGVKMSDEGEYSCEITTKKGIESLAHYLIVQVPPSISTIPANGIVRVKEGEPATLRCAVEGKPFPGVVWFRKDTQLNSVHPTCSNNTCITIANVKRSSAGEYFCQADNGITDPVRSRLLLTVLYKPEVWRAAEFVQGGSGDPQTLSCKVSGEPLPTVAWYKDGQLIHESNYGGVKPGIGANKENYYLHITRSTADKFGNYTCEARNSVGRARVYTELHGRPSSPAFLDSRAGSGYLTSILSWRTESYFEILEYRILYKQVKKMEWLSLSVPGNSELSQYTKGLQEMEWTLSNLESGAEHECIIQGRNVYGWGDPSNIFIFKTSSERENGGIWGQEFYSSHSKPVHPNLALLFSFAAALSSNIFIMSH